MRHAVACAVLCCSLAAPPALAGSASDFDFWIGEWDLHWTDAEGETVRGHNTISRILGGHIVREFFVSEASPRLTGISLSAYDAGRDDWGQTWVDDSGSYLDFRGGMVGGRMILSRSARRDGQTFLQRMVWQDIRADSLLWHWERSTDQGRSWTVVWAIHYQRKATQ